MPKIFFLLIFTSLLIQCKNKNASQVILEKKTQNPNLKTEDNQKDTTTIENKIVELEAKALLELFFKPYKFLSNKSALYKSKGGNKGVIFNKIEYLKIGNRKSVLAFFSSGAEEQVDGNGLNISYHIRNGILSIAKLEQVSEKQWKVISFVEDWSDGGAMYGLTSIPNLVKIGDVYFLHNQQQFGNHGYLLDSTNYYEIDKFQCVLSSAIESNAEMLLTEEKYKYSYQSNIKLFEKNKVIKAIVTYTGTKLSEDDKVVDASSKETYYYDKANAKFIKASD